MLRTPPTSARTALHAASANAAAGPQARVLVVGGGPVGLATAFLLERVYGVRTRIVERQATPTAHPQAHFLNLRTMEVLHAAMPAFHDRLLAHAAPSDLWRDYSYTTGVGKAREFARIDQFGSSIPRGVPLQDARTLASLSPTQFLHFPQNRFETMLSAFVQESGITLEREVELVALTLDDALPPRVQLKHVRSQDVEDASFDFVIGADGAHSRVRELSGIDMVGARNLQSIVNLHFTSSALSRAAREHPAMLYFVFNQHDIGVLIAHDLHHGEWVFQIPFFPPQETIADDFSVEQCKAIVRRLLTVGAAKGEDTDRQRRNAVDNGTDDVRILSVGQWQMSARVAKQYDRDARVFLVGDAAHQFPPAGGFGMNTGIQDAHNLAWKLAWTMQQQEQQQRRHSLPVDALDLLRSYERERQHVAKINTQLSLRNVERTMKIPSALHVSHNNAKLLAGIVNSPPVKYLPLRLQRDAIQGVMAVGKKPLALLDSTSSALGARMRRHVREIVDARASLAMLFYHFDIGFSYDTASWAARAKQLMQDDALNSSAQFALAGPPAKASSSSSSSSDAASAVFRPEFRVGARLPHFWCIAPDAKSATNSVQWSSVALVNRVPQLLDDAQRVRFLLLVDAAHQLELVADHASESESDTDSESGVWRHVAVVAMTNDDGSVNSKLSEAPRAAAPVVRLQVDVQEHATSALWREFTSSYAAALVRPDGHIAHLWDRKPQPHRGQQHVLRLDALELQRAMQHALQISRRVNASAL